MSVHHDKIRTNAYRKFRRYALAHEPLCRDCAKDGRTRAAEQLHHKVPLSKGGDVYKRSNVVPLCVLCHKLRHKRWRFDKRGFPL